MKTLRFGLFENAQSNDSGTSTWRHPDSERHNFDTLDYWLNIARLCEEAKFDFLFLADAWGWADVNGKRPPICDTEGLDLPRLDPFIVGAALIAATEKLGIVMTGSTLLEQPYAFARRMQSLDHLSKGRVGWNVVTTGTAETAVAAFGVPMVAHDKRYDMADDFMALAYKLFEGAWEPDALERNKQGRYANPDKVHRIAHDGPWFRSHGFGNSAYSPQGTPVLFQAGSSDRGKEFGGKHGECIFLGGGTPEKLAAQVASIRAEAAANGRAPDSVKIMSAFSCVIADSKEHARRKHQEILDAQTPEVAVASYAWFTGLDLSAYAPSTKMSELHTEMSQTQIARFGDKTVGDVLKDWHAHGVRTNPYLGTPDEIADIICDLAEKTDLDGFLFTPLIQPGSTRDVALHVMPILRARGVAAAEYEKNTLRERLLGTPNPGLRDDHPGARYRAA